MMPSDQTSTSGCEVSDGKKYERGSPTWPLVLPPLQHLGRSVPRRTAERLHEVAAFKLARETEIAELDSAALVQQHVLQLQIAVHDALLVQVGNCEAELSK